MTCLNPKLNKVPKDDWLCPRCVEDGVTVEDLRVIRAQTTPTPGPLLRGKPVPLLPDATFRRRRQELWAFHGHDIAHKTRVSGKAVSKLGNVHNHVGLKCFRMKFKDGSSMSAL
jgi:hypothetical protein